MKLFEYLSLVKKRPGMYMTGEMPLKELEYQIHGYLAAVRLHQIPENVLEFNTGLNDYIWKQHQWSTNQGWAEAITRNSGTPEESVKRFFEIANSFIEDRYGQRGAINENNVQLSPKWER